MSARRACSTTVPSASAIADKASTSVGEFSSTQAAMSSTNFLNDSSLATKSVSQLTSTITPLLSLAATICPMMPSAAIRPAFLSALAAPFLRSNSTALSMSPPVSVSALLQSIIPAPVHSRNSFTSDAVIAIEIFLGCTGPSPELRMRRAFLYPLSISQPAPPTLPLTR